MKMFSDKNENIGRDVIAVRCCSVAVYLVESPFRGKERARGRLAGIVMDIEYLTHTAAAASDIPTSHKHE